jgi:hypothetical protein
VAGANIFGELLHVLVESGLINSRRDRNRNKETGKVVHTEHDENVPRAGLGQAVQFRACGRSEVVEVRFGMFGGIRSGVSSYLTDGMIYQRVDVEPGQVQVDDRERLVVNARLQSLV